MEVGQHKIEDFELNIRRIRKGLKLTQAQFGERVGVSTLTVHRWETGESVPHQVFQQKIREIANGTEA